MGDNLISKTWGEATFCRQLATVFTLRCRRARWVENWGWGKANETGEVDRANQARPGKPGGYGSKDKKVSGRVGFSSIT